VVHDKESCRLWSDSNNAFTSDDLPAPEGATIINILPLYDCELVFISN
jgi:hypothetical protein